MAGNADAIARIGWDNTDARRGARDFLRLSEQTSKSFGKLWDGVKFGAGFMGIGSLAMVAAKGIEMVKKGLDFNTEMSDAEAGIANVLRRFDGLNRVAAKNEAAKAMQMIADLEPVTAGGLQDLVGGFMGTVAAAKAVGLTTEQNIQLVSKFANALANAGLPVDQLRQEMASILSGNITSDSQLAKILGITNEDINGIKASGGDLFEFLNGKIGAFGEAGDSASVVFSSFESAMSKFLGTATEGAFEQIVAITRDLTEGFDANAGAADAAGKSVGNYLFILRQAAQVAGEAAKAQDGAGGWLDKLGDVGRTLVMGPIYGPLMKGGKAKMPADFAENVDRARMDEQRKLDELARVKEIQRIEKAMNQPGVSDSTKVKMQEEINALKMEGVRIDQLASEYWEKNKGSWIDAIKEAQKLYAEETKAKNIQKQEDVAQVQRRQKANEQQVKFLQVLFDEEQKLQEIRRSGLLNSLTLAEQLAYVEGEIAKARQDVALLPYTDELQRVKREQELEALLNERAGLQRQINQEEERSLEQAAERAKAEAEIAMRQAESLEEYQMQNAILREQIAGHDEKAKQLQRELEIQRQAKQIQEQMGVSEADALRMARERADLEDQANKKRNNSRYDEEGRRKSDGRKRIVTRQQEDFQLPGGAPSRTPNLDEFYRKNAPGAPRLNETFRFPSLDGMKKGGTLRDEFQFPSLDAFDQMQKDKDSMKDKAQENNAEKGGGDRNVTVAQQVIQKMDQILQSLN